MQRIITNTKTKAAHPSVFMILILPFGIVQGYLTVTLAFLYSMAGMPVERIAAMVGISMVPNIIMFLWAPLVDLTLTVKNWYIIASCITAAGILCIGACQYGPQVHSSWRPFCFY